MTVDDDQPAPQPLPGLRAHRSALKQEELRVSYWRRLVQGRLDLIDVALAGGHPSAADVEGRHGSRPEAPADAGVRPARAAQPAAAGLESPVPEIEALWDQPVPWEDLQQLDRVRRTLTDVEQRLSEFRHLLHGRMDACSAEIVSRYQHDPSQISDPSVLLSGLAADRPS